MPQELLFLKNPTPMWFYDRETLQFLAVNEAALHKYKYSEDEFLNSTIRLIRNNAEAERLLKELQHIHGTKLSQSGLWLHKDSIGNEFYVRITSMETDFNGRSARFVMAADVQDFMREKQLNELLVKRLRKQIVFLRKVAWMQSHQLRARIANLLGLLNLYDDKLIDASEHNNCVELLKKEANDLDGLTRKISKKINGYTKLDWSIPSSKPAKAKVRDQS